MKRWWATVCAVCCVSLSAPVASRAADDAPEFTNDIAPILRKYCAGCHNGKERDGDFAMDSFAQLMEGGESGAAIKPGDGDGSRIIAVLTGKTKPTMPPKDKPAPTADEVALLKQWIDAGAKPPTAGAVPLVNVPAIKPAADAHRPITAAAYSPDGKWLAVGRFGIVELLTADKLRRVRAFTDLPGKVHAVSFSRDGSKLIAATGVNGLYGKAIIWNAESGEVERAFVGHADAMYDAALGPDGRTLATCSYDRRIILWNAATGDRLRQIAGHNGAVFDLAFSNDGAVLASAGADETVKLWRVADGRRLDTLHQPQAEQYCVTFSPDGEHIIAGGADNRIRVWRFVSLTEPAINPLIHARFAHEGAIVGLAFAHDGQTLISAAEDRTVKLWETRGYTQAFAYEAQRDVPAALVANPRIRSFIVGRMDGTLNGYPIRSDSAARDGESIAIVEPVAIPDAQSHQVTELEPNDAPRDAMPIELPAVITGIIHASGEDASEVANTGATGGGGGDADLFRFTADSGQQWVLEVNAARSKSPLDSKIEVLDADGDRIERVRLQAVRDSYFTFRGKDSDTSDDFRVKNWQEMELNEFLYANGEVVKLWHYPRGPDSGFMVYPGFGKRHGYFDTTPLAHPLHAPCYIVRPVPAGAEPLPNGLPLFPIYYENDDESERRFGADSQLTFTAPRDGQFLARITDVRGFGGADYKYELTIRPRRPDFRVRIEGGGPTVNAGSGKEFTVKAERIDGFEGEIRVDIEGAPPGFHVTSPIIIETGQYMAVGTINALPDAAAPTDENRNATKATATAVIAGKEVTKDIGGLGEIKLAGKPKLLVRILPSQDAAAAGGASGDLDNLELTIGPGETITAVVRVERNGFDGRVEFGNADAGRNLPHGVYVDNIGLNGLLIVEGTSQRTFFITAAKWVKPTTRTFFLRAKADGTQTSWPVTLRIVEK